MSPIRLHNAWRWSSIFLSFTLFVPSYQLIKQLKFTKLFSTKRTLRKHEHAFSGHKIDWISGQIFFRTWREGWSNREWTSLALTILNYATRWGELSMQYKSLSLYALLINMFAYHSWKVRLIGVKVLSNIIVLLFCAYIRQIIRAYFEKTV
jgi:hypothetical protein